ncbi:MAG: hypothetical protein ABIA63_00190 [bacterium]
MKITKKHYIAAGIIMALVIVVCVAFYRQDRACLMQTANAKLEGGNVGYEAGIGQGILRLNQALINNIIQYGMVMVDMPTDENGNFNIEGTGVRRIILKEYPNATTTQ